MKGIKRSYEVPIIGIIFNSKLDVLMSSGENFITNGEYNEDNMWEGFDALWD